MSKSNTVLCIACWFGECGQERDTHVAADPTCLCCTANAPMREGTNEPHPARPRIPA